MAERWVTVKHGVVNGMFLLNSCRNLLIVRFTERPKIGGAFNGSFIKKILPSSQEWANPFLP